jgi:hypothetical protein
MASRVDDRDAAVTVVATTGLVCPIVHTNKPPCRPAGRRVGLRRKRGTDQEIWLAVGLRRGVAREQDDGRSRTVDVHIRRLRLKLGAAGQQIQTVQGIGYRFNE